VYSELKALGCEEVKKVPLGEQILEGQSLQLPPAILASYGSFTLSLLPRRLLACEHQLELMKALSSLSGNDPKKKTILVYGLSSSSGGSEEERRSS